MPLTSSMDNVDRPDDPRSFVRLEHGSGGAMSRELIEEVVYPYFRGGGRVITDGEGRYRFTTIKPGAYPWRNHPNAWRPAHIHFSVFGTAFAQRLITQMYFEGDPLIARCPIVNTIPDQDAIDGLIAPLDLNAAVPLDSLAYKFDIVLRGRRSTLFENRLQGN